MSVCHGDPIQATTWSALVAKWFTLTKWSRPYQAPGFHRVNTLGVIVRVCTSSCSCVSLGIPRGPGAEFPGVLCLNGEDHDPGLQCYALCTKPAPPHAHLMGSSFLLLLLVMHRINTTVRSASVLAAEANTLPTFVQWDL